MYSCGGRGGEDDSSSHMSKIRQSLVYDTVDSKAETAAHGFCNHLHPPQRLIATSHFIAAIFRILSL
ncbi:hypothetical protein SISNIDRAFT_224740 [Sistotremastrum niveocremeum HHB9708]|uniref:Uncharacterized protein n=1 Tax=Sistotremastrum niveocremeum HHB9708 TaxID=1314777 RepID=A0A164QIC6_9AGAM|nr:hypothetical protein SISNIDRAFT_224740 [Sistotremastrum niveocremeum HHB9708]